MSADYAAVLRGEPRRKVAVPLIYMSALTLIRNLTRDDRFADADLGSEVRRVLAALAKVQEELDRREDGR